MHRTVALGGPREYEISCRGCGLGNFFTDVLQRDERFHSRKPLNDLDLLEPVTRSLVQQVIQEAGTLGISLMAFETYRSQDRQMDLFDQGKSQLHTVGVHHYGLACDLVRDVCGAPSWEGDFSFLKVITRRHRLIWGGDWGTPCQPHKLYDAVHVQRCSVARQGALFRGEWYPDDDYDPYAAPPDSDPNENGSITLMASAEVGRQRPRGVDFKTTRTGMSVPHGLLVGGAGGLDQASLVEAGL